MDTALFVSVDTVIDGRFFQVLVTLMTPTIAIVACVMVALLVAASVSDPRGDRL